jgi:hypothetical protein
VPVATVVPTPSVDATCRIVAGPVTFDVTIASTAQTFYIVDQLSEWAHTHPQYMRWASNVGLLSDREKLLLAQHREIRRRLHYGALDQTFATTLDPHAAVERAMRDKRLAPDDIVVEGRALETFGPLVRPLLDRRAQALEAFRTRLEGDVPKLSATLESLVAFVDARDVDVIPVFLVADPSDHGGGGGMNGGIAWIEVSDGEGSMKTFLFDAFGAVLRRRDQDMGDAARACGEGLDAETLNNAVLKAFSPGMTSAALSGRDELAASVASARAAKTPSTDGYLRSARFGLALRPILESAITRHGTFASFLTNVCPMWKAMQAEAWP